MEGKIYNRRNRTRMVLVYLSVYFAYLAISRVVPLVHAMTDPVDALISSAMAGFGVLLLVQDLFTDRYAFKSRYWYVLVAFMVVLGLSSLTNIRYGMVDNLKTMVWTCIHLFLVYSIVPRLGGEKGERFVRRVLWGIGALWTVCVLISVAQYVFQISYREMMHADLWKRQGFVDNRLFGLFSDPNAAALMSICLVFAIIYLMETDKCVWKRCIGVGAVVLHCAYIILSGSRTAVICLLIGAAVKTALVVWNFCCGKGFRAWRTAVYIVAGVAVFSAVFAGIYGLAKQGLAYVPQLVEKTGVQEILPQEPEGLLPGMPQVKPGDPTSEEPYDAESMFQREDVREDNILNNRQNIWKGYLDSLHGAKWIFGLSPRNAVSYITQNQPDNYIAKSGYIAHSDYIAVVAYTGLAGVAVVLLFGALAAVFVFRKLREQKRCSSFYMMVLVCLCSMGVFAVSYMDILFCNTITGVLFWTMVSVVLNDSREGQSNERGRME